MNKVSNRIESLSIVASSRSVSYGFSTDVQVLNLRSSVLHQPENPDLIWSFNLFFKFSNPRRNLDSNAVWVWTCLGLKLQSLKALSVRLFLAQFQPYLSGGFWWDLFVNILSTPPITHNNPNIVNRIRSVTFFNWSAPMNCKCFFRTFIIYLMILNWLSQNFW